MKIRTLAAALVVCGTLTVSALAIANQHAATKNMPKWQKEMMKKTDVMVKKIKADPKAAMDSNEIRTLVEEVYFGSCMAGARDAMENNPEMQGQQKAMMAMMLKTQVEPACQCLAQSKPLQDATIDRVVKNDKKANDAYETAMTTAREECGKQMMQRK